MAQKAWKAGTGRTRISIVGRINNKNSGYAYIMMLVMMASIGLTASVLGVIIFSRDVRIEKEKELLFRGMAYVTAIKSYNLASKGKKEFPARLEILFCLLKPDRSEEHT